MTASTEFAGLRKKLLSRMPILEQRARIREVDAVLREAMAKKAVTPKGFLKLAADYAAQAKECLTQFETVRSEYAQARTDEQRTAVLKAELRRQKAPHRTFSALRRGWLDLDALSERAEIARHELLSRQAIALRAAAAFTEERVDRKTIDILSEALLTDLPEICAMACTEALSELLSRAAEWPDSLDDDGHWPRICARILETNLPRRLRAALARLCLEATPHLAMEAFTALLSKTAGGDDFVLRQHLVVLLGRHFDGGAAFTLLTEHVHRADVSEHVRLALPTALRTAGGRQAVPLLEAMAGACENGSKADESPRVRAQAAIALAELLRMGEADTSAALAYLVADPDPLVNRIVSEEIELLAKQRKITLDQAVTLTAAFARPAADVGLREPARHALEALATVGDHAFAAAEEELGPQLAALAEGEIVVLQTGVEQMILGRLLARLARDGFGYNAWPVSGGYCVERGARFLRSTWRILHELRNRTPYKRQDILHTVGRKLRGTLRAPSGLLAEATPTSVPGEPLESSRDSGSGAHLPTVDDLLSLPILNDEAVTLFGDFGLTQIKPPRSLVGRVWTRLRLIPRYAWLSEQRRHAIDPVDASERNRYVESLEAMGIGIHHRPYSLSAAETGALLRTTPIAKSLRSRSRALQAGTMAMFMMPPPLDDLGRYLMSPAENSLGQLGFAVAFFALYLLARNLYQQQQIRDNRASIPLCIGGWGTRGKSGTERLKAALLHAQDINVLTKTTGCEAMFIHGVPGRKPTEIFIHRSYDKATIWEQRDMLSLAARLRVDAFLWECMALSGPLVHTLSEDWMRDDLQTLTNAYPDHEEIQGPAGHDVARSIAGFMRSGGTTITSEDQMLPILAAEAERKNVRLIPVTGREHLLLGEDLLARFPYREHPRNIALVRRLAVELGLDPDLATADMADNVVPDLGVLKTYPAMQHRGRRLIFVNGMSANERTGFLSNWQRTGCERPVDQPGKIVVTVVNNRFDRVARSQVFADILVRDAAAERHVLIGTNLSGLRTYIDQALSRFLPELRLFQDDDAPGRLPSLIEARCQRIRHRLRIGSPEAPAILAEISGWLDGIDLSSLRGDVEAALAAAEECADRDESLTAIMSKLLKMPLCSRLAEFRPESSGDLSYHASRTIARRALFASLEQAAKTAIETPAARKAVIKRQDRLYRELFLEIVTPIEDPGASGDQIIDIIARTCPPGIEATVMGIQNIKGTGLDFVYRFIRYDEVRALVLRLEKANAREALDIAHELLVRNDFGMLDAALAVRAVKDAAARFEKDHATADSLMHSAERLAEIAEGCQAAMKSGQGQKRNPLVRVVEKTFDTVDAVRRRWRADAILDALVHREISHERAAFESRNLVYREKKGWLRT